MDKRKTHIINSQENLLIEYLKKHPKMVAGKYDHSYTYKNYVANWEDLSNILNAVPGGACKMWKSWRKTWQDKKSRTKKKISITKIAAQKTGGGPCFIPEMTETEEKMLQIIKPVAIEGDTSVQESSVANIYIDPNVEVIYEESEGDFDLSNESSNAVEIVTNEYTPNILYKSQGSSLPHSSQNKSGTSASETRDENRTPNIPYKSQGCSSSHSLQKKSVTLATTSKSQESETPRKKSKASEIASAVNHFKTITITENDIRKDYYKEKLKKLDKIIILKERKCKAIERLAEAVEKLSA